MLKNQNLDLPFGSTTIPVHTERETPVLALYESELDTITHFNTHSSAAFTVAVALLAYILSSLDKNGWNQPTADQIVISILVVLLFLISYALNRKKKTLIQKIKESCKRIDQPQ